MASTSTASGCAGRQCCASANGDEEDGNKHSGHRDLVNQLREQIANAQQHDGFPKMVAQRRSCLITRLRPNRRKFVRT
jgi:hypothetical protein